MDGIQAKMKRWVSAITALEIEEVTAELQVLLNDCDSEQADKSLFKLLLHLSHAAYRVDKTKSPIGLEIWKLGSFLCSNMSVIRDYKRFFLSVFHVSQCLLQMGLYEEALMIYDRAIAHKNSEDDFTNYSELYSKASNQWKATVCNDLLKKLDPTSEEQRRILTRAIEYELKMSMLASAQYSRVVLDRLVRYRQQIRAIAKRSAKSSLEEHFEMFATSFLSTNEVSLDNGHAFETFGLICQLISEMTTGSVNEKGISSVGKKSSMYFDFFRSSVNVNRTCRDCFVVYERLCRTLLRPIRSFEASAVEDIEACASELQKTICRTGSTAPVREFLYSAYSLFSPLLAYWEEAVRKKSANLTHDFIVAAMKLFSICSDAYYTYENSCCRCDESCLATRDVYSAVSLRLKSLSVAARAMSLSVSAELCAISLRFIYESLSGISSMKKSGCKRWIEHWASCGAYMYNMGVSCEPKYYEYSVQFHSSLCQNLICLEGPRPAKPIVNLKDPLCDVLHRLTSVHWNHGRYHEASIACCLNGLLSCGKPEGRAYRYWANIKRKNPESHGVTMLRFLRWNDDEMSKILRVELNDHEKIQVCLREIKGLQEARVDLSSSIAAAVDELERLDASPAQYARGVQLLGYHLLNFKHETSIANYVKKAMLKYEAEASPGVSFRWCYGQLQFYDFIERLADIRRKTEAEMNSAEVPQAYSSADGESTTVTPSVNIVPTYSTINLTVTTELERLLKFALRRWEDAHRYGFKGTLKEWETSQALHSVTIAGEYARLYNFESLEVRAWKLAYKLAEELNDDKAIIYATSRRLSTLEIDAPWIDRANESAKVLESLNDEKTNETLVRYRLSLANFYFAKDKSREAKACMRQAEAKMGLNFLTDITNYLVRNDIILNHMWNEEQSEDHHFIYHEIMVEILYSLLTLDSTVDTVQYGGTAREKQLYEYDVLHEHTNNLTVRANSLLAFQEITAHLNLRLTASQKMGAALKVAECLTSLCHIDLSRALLDDCEVKLQGLEHILDIGLSKLSVNSALLTDSARKRSPSRSPARTPERATVRSGQSDASPVLRRKIFVAPEFMLHGDVCKCFKCANKRYRYLVFACTHLRAYLYTLQGHSELATQYFNGAFKIWKSNRMEPSATSKDTAKRIDTVPLQCQQEMLEYVMLHINYCRFLKFYTPSKKTSVVKSWYEALTLCEAHHLKDHPIYVSVNEFILEYRFQKTYTKAMCSNHTVPAIEDINISCYVDERAKPPIAVSTPAREVVTKEMKSVRRKKIPPFLKLNKVPIDLTKEDDEPPISTSPTSTTKRTRRKITDQDYSDWDAERENSASKFSAPKIKVTTPEENPSTRWQKRKVAAGVSSTASISLNSVGESESFETSQSPEKIDELIGMIQELQVRPETQSSTRTRTRKKSQQESASSCPLSIAELSGKPCETMNKVTESRDEATIAKQSSNTGKPAKNSDRGRLKKSSLVSTGGNTNTLSPDEAGDTTDDGRRTSARLRKKSNDLSIPKSSTLKSLDKSGGSASNSEDEVVITSTRTRKRAAASSSVQPTQAKEVSKSTRARVTKRDNENPQSGRKTDG